MGLVGALTANAAAQTQGTPPADDASSNDPKLNEARTAFREGTSLARQAQWGEALLAFERSASLRPHTFTTYNIGYCERALGRYTRARKFLAKALAENEARGGTALSADLVVDAKKYLSELEKRVARATVTLEPPDAAVAVDDRPLEVVAGDRTPPVLAAGTRDLGVGEAPPSASFELLLDPGAHVFIVSRAGSSDVVLSRTFSQGTTTPLDLRLALAPATAKSSVPSAAAAPSSPGGRDHARPYRLSAYGFLGVGALGLATGAVAGILAIQEKKKLDEGCRQDGSCSLDLVSHHDALNRWADVSTIAFSVGAVAMGVSTVLFLSGGGSAGKGSAGGPPVTQPSTTGDSTAKTGLVVRPTIGYGSAFLSGSF
jgi:hypothetical protein